MRGWENESGRSVANVTWVGGVTNVYRLGHKGKVDLKYIADASGGHYYRDHLPTLGKAKIGEYIYDRRMGASLYPPMVSSSTFSSTSYIPAKP